MAELSEPHEDTLYRRVAQIIESARQHVARSVNSAMVLGLLADRPADPCCMNAPQFPQQREFVCSPHVRVPRHIDLAHSLSAVL